MIALEFTGLVRPEHDDRPGHSGDTGRDALALLAALCEPDPPAVAVLLDNLACAQCTAASLAYTLTGVLEAGGLDALAVITAWQEQARTA